MYDWSDGPAELQPHSKAKHEILGEYIQRYIEIMTMTGTVPLRLRIIDGFAGAGDYKINGIPHDGSPVILIKSVLTAIEKLKLEREKPPEIEVDFIFIEKKHENYDRLRQTLNTHFPRTFLEAKVTTIHGVFEEHAEAIIRDMKSTKGRKPYPIFVLDQYGYSDVPMNLIVRIMNEFKKAEVFLTLAVDNIAAFKNSLRGALEQLRASLRVDTSTIERVVNGRLTMADVLEFPTHDRNQIMGYIQCILHEAFARHSGAKHYTPFFITSTKSHRSYWFLHLANHARANDAVKQLHWDKANTFKHHGRPGMKMLVLGFDPARTPREQLDFGFDASAKQSSIDALINELPEVLAREQNAKGISLNQLYENICNETPASKEIVREVAGQLCVAGEWEKKGRNQEERKLTTKLHDDDIIRRARQLRLFSVPSKYD